MFWQSKDVSMFLRTAFWKFEDIYYFCENFLSLKFLIKLYFKDYLFESSAE